MTNTYAVSHDDALRIARRKSAPTLVRPTKPPFPWALGLRTVGVTGTNGKTSTTQMVAHLLGALSTPVLKKTTLGCFIDEEKLSESKDLRGYLQSFGRLAERSGTHAAVEVTSQALSIGYAKFWRFDVGIFTNLSHDHLNAHGSFEHYLASKAQLFVHLPDEGAAVLNAADDTSALIEQVTPPSVRRLRYGVASRGSLSPQLDLAARAVHVSWEGTRIELFPSDFADALGRELRIPFVGEVYAENALGACLAAAHLGHSPEDIPARLAACPLVPGRFEVVSTNPTVVVDFAHTPDALLRVCRAAKQLIDKGRLLVVFGAGGERDADKRVPMGEAVGKYADVVFITTDNPRREDPKKIADALAAGVSEGQGARQAPGAALCRMIPDRARAMESALSDAGPGDVVLITGRGHETTQEIAGNLTEFDDAAVVRRLLGV
jgi:UDP-N-acetylmuramoyl-L-alanyl-D-glutamate--2,6-diaminopimelate ligase